MRTGHRPERSSERGAAPLERRLDALVAALLALLGVVSMLGGAAGARPADLVGVLLVLAGAGSLVVARQLPLPVLALSLAASLAVLQRDHHQSGGGLTVLWALHVVAARTSLPVSAAATIGTLLLVHVGLTTAPDATTTTDRVSTTLVLGAGWAFGRAARARAARRAAEERAAVAEDRAVIAREMQDLVAHDLAELTVQVVAARRVVPRDPQAAAELLEVAETTARGAVTEVRRILALLDPVEDAAPAVVPADLRPLPGLADLPTLARDLSPTGLPVDLSVDVPDVGVAPGPGLLAYRAVEGLLAQAARRGATAAQVEVTAQSGALRVCVRDDGSAAGEAAPGATDTLRRRARLYGGTLDRQADAAGTRTVLEIPATGTRRTP